MRYRRKTEELLNWKYFFLTWKHESCESCALKLGLLGQVHIMAQLDSPYQRNILEHNEETEENRYEVGRLISCIKLCGKCELWDDVPGRHQAEKILRFGEWVKLFFWELMDVSMQSARTQFCSFSSMFCCCYLFQFCFILYATCVPQA